MKNFDEIVDEFFDEVSPNEVVKIFEELGYKFDLKETPTTDR